MTNHLTSLNILNYFITNFVLELSLLANISFRKRPDMRICGQVFTWSNCLWVSSPSTLVVLFVPSNLQLGYKLHDFPLKFFFHGNYRRRRRKSYFRQELRCRDATVIWSFSGETLGAMYCFSEERMTGYYWEFLSIDEW